MWQEVTELSECLLHRTPGSPTLTLENGSESSVSPHLLLEGRLAPHLLHGLGLPMHLVVSLRSGQRMHGEGDAGKAPNFLGNDQPWDFYEASERDDLSLSATALSFSGASKSEQVGPIKAKVFKWGNKNITQTYICR